MNKKPYPFFLGLLQVEQLFRLGLRSRAECEELLQRCRWNLEESCRLLLDTYPNKTCKWRHKMIRSVQKCPNMYVHLFVFFAIRTHAIAELWNTTCSGASSLSHWLGPLVLQSQSLSQSCIFKVQHRMLLHQLMKLLPPPCVSP